jgi:hypothetical protein
VLKGLPQVGQTSPGWVRMCSLPLSAGVAGSEGQEMPRVRVRLLKVCSEGKGTSHLDLGSC